MKRILPLIALSLLLTGCGNVKAKIESEKKAKALEQCVKFAKKEARDPSDPDEKSKIINQCMEASGYYGFDYKSQGK